MFTGIPHTEIDSVWEDALPLIADACTGRISPESYYKSLKNRESQLWIYRDSCIKLCVITEIVDYPDKSYCRLCVVTGTERENWQHNLSIIEAWARSQGCDGMEALARKGWGRILKDYKTTHIFIEKEF